MISEATQAWKIPHKPSNSQTSKQLGPADNATSQRNQDRCQEEGALQKKRRRIASEQETETKNADSAGTHTVPQLAGDEEGGPFWDRGLSYDTVGCICIDGEGEPPSKLNCQMKSETEALPVLDPQ